MTMHTKVGGAWKTVNTLYTKVGGAWKTVNTAYVKVGGAWKPYFTSLNTPNITVSDLTKAGIGGTSNVSFTIANNGTGTTTGATTSTPGSFTWLASGTPSEYEVYITGSGTGSPTNTGTWLSLGTSRTCTLSATNNDVSWTGTYQIRKISETSITSTGSVSMEVATAP